MTTKRIEFVDLANELFLEFEDFQGTAIFEDANLNQLNGTKTVIRTQTIAGFQTENIIKVFGDRNISVGDKLQVYKYRDLQWIPEVGVTTIKFNNVENIIKNMKIVSDIAIFFHVSTR